MAAPTARMSRASRSPTLVATLARSAVSYGTFPLCVFGIVALAIELLDRGWSPLAVHAATGVPFLLATIALERLHPHDPRWNRSTGDTATDTAHWLISNVFVQQLALATVTFVCSPLSTWLATRWSGPIWPTQWPVWAQLVLALAISELGFYGIHRLQHERALLWRFHAIHHSAQRLYWLNASRFHPLDMLVVFMGGLSPLLLLGCPARVLVLWALLGGILGTFKHANLRLRHGVLNYVFSTAELHHRHHSRNVAESNSNYGSNLVIWDLLFGTWHLPRRPDEMRDVGIAGSDPVPSSYLAQLAFPFRSRR